MTKYKSKIYKLGNKNVGNFLMRIALYVDYAQFLNEVDNHLYYKNRRLLSWSAYNRGLSDCMLSVVPEQILDTAREIGKEFMEKLQYIFDNKIVDIENVDYSTSQIRNMIIAFYNHLVRGKYKLLAVEKLITNLKWIGFIDCVVLNSRKNQYEIWEIKTRSQNKDVRESDFFQLNLYGGILNNRFITKKVIIVNKNTFEVIEYPLKSNMFLMRINNMVPNEYKFNIEALDCKSRRIEGWEAEFEYFYDRTRQVINTQVPKDLREAMLEQQDVIKEKWWLLKQKRKWY